MNLFVFLMIWEDRIPILRLHDWLLAPFYLAVLFAIAYLLRAKYTRRRPETKKYFIPALICRFIGCFSFTLLFQFYYNGGDTWAYHWGAIAIWKSFWVDPKLFIEILTSEAGNYSYEAYNFFRETQATWYIAGEETMTVMKVAGIIYLFTFQSYLCTGFILAFLTMIASWKIYEVFYDAYPHLHKYLAYGILFVPSVLFWGAAGLMKDTLVLIGLGFGFWGVYQLMIRRRNIIKSLIYIPFGFYTMFTIKPYVVIVLIPTLLVWIILHYSNKISNDRIRIFFKPFIFSLAILGSLSAIQLVSSGTGRFSSDSILQYAVRVQIYSINQTTSSDGSGYDLGDYEPTVLGLLKMVPKAINVTLFRPYPWESRKIVLIPNIFEGIISFLVTLLVLWRVGPFRTLKAVFSNSMLIFAVLFSLIFAFAVGFTTYNFGSLARYKIPALPFYFASLAIIYDEYLKRRKKKTKRLPPYLS